VNIEKIKKEFLPKKVTPKEIPHEVFSDILISALKGVGLFAVMSVVLIVVTGGNLIAVFAGLGLVVLIGGIVGSRIYQARRDITLHIGEITGWKKEMSAYAFLDSVFSAPSRSIKKRVTHDPDTFRKAGISFYTVRIDGYKRDFLVPITRTNNPISEGTDVKVYASKTYKEDPKYYSFDRVYSLIEIDHRDDELVGDQEELVNEISFAKEDVEKREGNQNAE
jgi:hypothetical protein